MCLNSIWSAETTLPEFGRLGRDIKTDVLIVGGGLTGLLCAYFLTQRGVDCVVAEGSRICGGTTKNTTAKITAQHGFIYNKLISGMGQEKARLYLEANLLALRKYAELCDGIDCGFEYRDNFVYSLDDKGVLEKELAALDKIGFKAELAQELSLPFETAGAVCFPQQAQFDPLKLAASIAGKLRIYENTFIREIRGKTALTDGGSIIADKIIIASHFPFINKHGSYFLKLYQSRSYVIALKNAPDIGGMYVDGSGNGLSFRNYRDYLLLGGGAHRTGKNGGNWTVLRKFAKKYYPEAGERYCWAAQDCMSLDGAPYIGQYSKRTPGLYTAAGFNKWGMTGAMTAAMLLSDMVCGVKNEYAEVFSPSRSMLTTQLLANGFEAVVNILSFSAKRCPHLGCALKWNKSERTWDCPCHGSRFTCDGKLIDNPATGNLKK